MRTKELLNAVESSNISITELANTLGYSKRALIMRISNDKLTVVDAVNLQHILKFQKPEDIFFG